MSDAERERMLNALAYARMQGLTDAQAAKIVPKLTEVTDAKLA